MKIICDFHVRTCLSPNCDVMMSPRYVVDALAEKNVKLACLTDLNTALNCPAFYILCRRRNIIPLSGMEAVTAEGISALVIFADLRLAVDFCSEWYRHLNPLPLMENQKQYFVDENGEILGELKKNLLARSDVGIEELLRQTHDAGGLLIPSEVNRKSLILDIDGKLPAAKFDAVEFSYTKNPEAYLRHTVPVINGDAPLTLEATGSHGIELDTGLEPLFTANGNVSLEAILSAFEKFRVSPSTPRI